MVLGHEKTPSFFCQSNKQSPESPQTVAPVAPVGTRDGLGASRAERLGDLSLGELGASRGPGSSPGGDRVSAGVVCRLLPTPREFRGCVAQERVLFLLVLWSESEGTIV